MTSLRLQLCTTHQTRKIAHRFSAMAVYSPLNSGFPYLASVITFPAKPLGKSAPSFLVDAFLLKF